MTYATTANLVEAFGELELIQLTDVNAVAIDQARVDRALASADELLNSYISRRYPLPLPSTPPVLTSRACDIARFRLHKEGMHEEVRERYEEAVAWAKDVAAGRANLPFPDSATQPSGLGAPRFGQAISGFDWSAY